MRRMSSANLAEGEESRRFAEETIGRGVQVQSISSWAAIPFTPALIVSIYGMNVDHMPELHWTWGYPLAVALMVGFGVSRWGVLEWSRWL